MRITPLLFSFILIMSHTVVKAQAIATGPRKGEEKPVRLLPIPLSAKPAEIQALIDRHHNVYFGPGNYRIGNLRLEKGQKGLIWGAGRLTTTLTGSITISGSRDLVLGNFNVNHVAAKGAAVIEVVGKTTANLTLLNTLVSAGNRGVAIRVKAPGRFNIQGCNPKWSDIGISIQHPKAVVYVFGGNLQYNRLQIEQVQGHLDARAFGMQGTKGEADILIRSPSPVGFHLLEGIRTEGNNGANAREALLNVPLTGDKVNVVLRANTLGNMVRYANYGANGNLVLLENANDPGPEDKSSVGVTTGEGAKANVISLGNKYGLSYDEAIGPFVVGKRTTVRSMGDLWMLPNKTDYKKPFNEPLTTAAVSRAGKPVSSNVEFFAPQEAVAIAIPEIPLHTVATFPRIANLADLMLNITEFGARPNDGKDDREAIQRALDSAEKDGISKPLYFPAGRYELSAPLFLDQLAGGGFWGEGSDKTVLVSTTGKGVLTANGAGYTNVVDIGFENRPGAETATTDLDWPTNISRVKSRGRTGAALQANMFYRCRFENGGTGIAVGRSRMGDGFMLVDCVFRNIKTGKGEGAAYVSENFNVLTNPLVHCLFENVDCAVNNKKGSFNFYGNRLVNIRTAALKFYAVVSDGFALVNNDMDASPVPFITTGHSSAKAHLLVDRVRIAAPAKQTPASSYTLGGSVLFLSSSFPARTITNSGGIGDNSLIVFKTVSARASATGRAHGYIIEKKK